MAVSTRKAKAAPLLVTLNEELLRNGAALDVKFGVIFNTGEHTAENIIAIGKALWVASRDTTAQMNMALGAWFDAAGSGEYGERSYILRRVLGTRNIESIRNKLVNYACIYRRWRDAGLQPGKSWTWHREHGLDSSGNAVRRVPSAAAKKLVLELSLRLYHEGTDDVRRLWFAACEALESMSDDDSDEFEENLE